jgi:hypothetical protein
VIRLESGPRAENLTAATTIMNEASTMIPLNDERTFRRSNSVGSSSEFGLADSGDENTTEYRLQATDNSGSRKISLWHDVSLVHLEQKTRKETEYFNFVCEIPKFSRWVQEGDAKFHQWEVDLYS